MHIVISPKENFLDFEITQLYTAHDIVLLYGKEKYIYIKAELFLYLLYVEKNRAIPCHNNIHIIIYYIFLIYNSCYSYCIESHMYISYYFWYPN